MSKSTPSQLIARRLAAEPSRLMELLPSLMETERRHICQMISPIVNDAEKWQQSYSFLPSGLVLPVAIVSIAQHPGHGFDEISTYVRMVLWISGFDDYFDDARLDTEALVRIKRDCLDIACGKPPIDVHPTALSLAELIVRLQNFPGWHVLDRRWLAALVQVTEGTLYEYFTRRAPGHRNGSSFQRPYAEYMYFAELTAALSFLWTTDLILVENRGIAPYVGPIADLANLGARIFRLANDTAGWQRDLEGSEVNGVAFLAAEMRATQANLSAEDAIVSARHQSIEDLERLMSRLRTDCARIGSNSGVERNLVRGLELAVDLYFQRDIRTWSAEFLRGAIGGEPLALDDT